jgi:phosphopantetheinyl transferase
MNTPELAGGIDVWLCQPVSDAVPQELHTLATLLSDDEHARIQRLRFEADRLLRLTAYGRLRQLLSCHDARPPEKWEFLRAPGGRPELTAAAAGLRFSVSHTRGLVAIAITLARGCGIDVEYLRDDLDAGALAPSMLGAPELEWFERLAEPARRVALYGVWTIKEAMLKGLGHGLARDPRQLVLVPDWSHPMRLVAAPGIMAAASGWTVALHGLGTHYWLALAWETTDFLARYDPAAAQIRFCTIDAAGRFGPVRAPPLRCRVPVGVRTDDAAAPTAGDRRVALN